MKIMAYVKGTDDAPAAGVSFAIEKDGVWNVLNGGEPLFKVSGEGKALKNPWIFRTKQGTLAVSAVRVNADGSNDAETIGKAVIFRMNDQTVFEEIGFINLAEEPVNTVRCTYGNDVGADRYFIQWADSGWQWHQASVSSIDKRVLSTSEIVSTTITEYGLLPMGDTEGSAEVTGSKAANAIEISPSEYDRLKKLV